MNQQMYEFIKSVLQTGFDCGSLDGWDIQELGIKHGLLVEEPYDPETHGDDWLGEIERGEPFYRYSDTFKNSFQ